MHHLSASCVRSGASMDAKELRLALDQDPDFVVAPRYGNSLSRVVQESPDPKASKGEPGQVPRSVLRMLRMTPDQAADVRDQALEKVRQEVKDLDL